MKTIIGVDPSGEFDKGKGTTGVAVLDSSGKLIKKMSIYAQDYPNRLAYWKAVCDHIETLAIRYDAVVSMEDYVLYAATAKAQINSDMATSKLIGAIMMHLYDAAIPLYMRTASQVMARWSNTVLEFEGYIKRIPSGYETVEDTPERIYTHELDALRHAVHCFYFELGKGKEIS